MANQLPPVLVTFDADVLMAGRTQVWQEYAKVGSCYLPEVVYDEIDYLTGKAVEKAQEQVAREFMRFFADSGWIVTDAQETHRGLEPSMKNQSAQAMLVVATAQCVYGLAQEHPDALVVFVSNSQPLLKRIASVGAANLCGITAAMLLNWARKAERPPAATQQLQSLMRTLADRQSTQRSNSRIQNAGVGKTGTSVSKFTMRGDSDLDSPSSSTKTNQTGLSGSPRKSSRTNAKKPVPSREERKDYEPAVYRIKHITPPKKRDGGFLSGAFNFLGALFFLTVAVGILWRVLDARGFRKTFVPALPQPVQQFVKSIDPK
ncbi:MULTISPECIES: PIN domain-containing protein [unclassified Microcoleus]|uniref:PIN domain-containing protein n=1 Tax=unclassified Microcoleus TaxID=2642155 RepID=UPI0025E1B4C4|nr:MULTISPECIES: PIN domain-containing protein [unclassified Microcoleus]